jgi:hypothetical protein
VSRNAAYFGGSYTYPFHIQGLNVRQASKQAAGTRSKLSLYCRQFLLFSCGAATEKTGRSLEVPTSEIFNTKWITERRVSVQEHEVVIWSGIYLLHRGHGKKPRGLIPTHTYQILRIVTLPTTAYFPVFHSSCYASHYSILPCIPLELLRFTLQRTSLHSPRVVTLPTTAYFPTFPSSHLAILFTGMLVVITFTCCLLLMLSYLVYSSPWRWRQYVTPNLCSHRCENWKSNEHAVLFSKRLNNDFI